MRYQNTLRNELNDNLFYNKYVYWIIFKLWKFWTLNFFLRLAASWFERFSSFVESIILAPCRNSQLRRVIHPSFNLMKFTLIWFTRMIDLRENTLHATFLKDDSTLKRVISSQVWTSLFCRENKISKIQINPFQRVIGDRIGCITLLRMNVGLTNTF